MKTLSGETKLIIGVIVISIFLLIGAMFFFSRQEQTTANPPSFTREELIPQGTQVKGNASASAYLVEFSDFQCPACKAFQPFVDEITTKYQNNLTFAYRHFPLTQHPYSEKAALAGEAAAKQGKFWEMGKSLFDNQEKLSDATVDEIVKTLGLNQEAFNRDKNDGALKDKIAKDIAEGNRFGVNSTPTFFLNGRKLLLRTPQDLTAAVEEAVK